MIKFIRLTNLNGTRFSVNVNQIRSYFRVSKENRGTRETFERYPELKEYTAINLGDPSLLEVRESFEDISRIISC